MILSLPTQRNQASTSYRLSGKFILNGRRRNGGEGRLSGKGGRGGGEEYLCSFWPQITPPGYSGILIPLLFIDSLEENGRRTVGGREEPADGLRVWKGSGREEGSGLLSLINGKAMLFIEEAGSDIVGERKEESSGRLRPDLCGERRRGCKWGCLPM